MRLVNHLVSLGVIDAASRSQIEAQAARWQVPAHTLLRTYGLLTPEVYRESYAKVYAVEAPAADSLVWNPGLAEKLPWNTWKDSLALPVVLGSGEAAVACTDPVSLPAAIRALGVRAVLILEEEWVSLVTKFRGTEFVDAAVNGLERTQPELSARRTFTGTQLAVIWAGLSSALAGLFFLPALTLSVLNITLNLFYFLCVAFKTVLCLVGSTRNVNQKVSRAELDQVDDASLPVYTILVPVYKEPAVIPHLVRQLASLDYPLCKLDVKVLLEEADPETREAFLASKPPPNFHAVVVPERMPKTKPKACNYGLLLIRGEYLTIYDAEDLPEADQLRKVIVAFRKLPANIVCIQACLNYFNSGENFLTRMFTLEYSMWFDYMLPGMEALKVPIPLGGTSNHFKTRQLLELGGWDPFNVTEDADLGVRASALGYTVATIDSTTFEEANCRYGNWIRQRSRWIKGYMQTFLVHMRNPARLLRVSGLREFLGFVLFIGGTPFVFLANPLLWLLLAWWLITRSTLLEPIFPVWLLALCFANLLLGNFFAVYTAALAVFRRRNFSLSPFALLNPVYWIMHSIAAYKGLWQLIVNPFYWEKTTHGLSTANPGQAHSGHGPG